MPDAGLAVFHIDITSAYPCRLSFVCVCLYVSLSVLVCYRPARSNHISQFLSFISPRNSLPSSIMLPLLWHIGVRSVTMRTIRFIAYALHGLNNSIYKG